MISTTTVTIVYCHQMLSLKCSKFVTFEVFSEKLQNDQEKLKCYAA